LQVARSLQNQLFFFEVEWGGRILQDGVEDVFMFYDEQDGGSDAIFEKEELPTGVVTMLTRCYSPSCADSGPEGPPCYSYSCPKRVSREFLLSDRSLSFCLGTWAEIWFECRFCSRRSTYRRERFLDQRN
jgi:hypothetical protein